MWGLVPRRARGGRETRNDPDEFTPSAQRSNVKHVEQSTWRISPAACASMLLGVTTGMVIAGMCARFEQIFGEYVLSGRAVAEGVVGTTLLALAIGICVPQRFAMWVCTVAWRRFLLRGQPSDISGEYLNQAGADRPLYWVVLSVIALAAGVATALLPPSVWLARAGYDWMYAHFLWSVGPLAILQVVIVFAAGLIPLTILGLAVSCVHHLSCPYGRWETRATAWLLIGAAVGTLISGWIAMANGHGSLILIAAALPALVVSLVSAASGSSGNEGSRQAVETEPVPLPIWSDRWPTLLRAGIVTVGAGSACALAVWIEYFDKIGLRPGIFVPVILLAMGVGVRMGCRAKRSGLRSVGGFGIACAAAGVIVAASTVVFTEPIVHSSGVAVLLACVSMVAVGFAMAYGRQTLLHRVASRSYAGATVLTRTLVSAALIVWLGAPIAVSLVGRPITLVILALSLLAMGGTLIVHEPGHSPRTRRARLCAVFGSAAAMIVLAWFTPHLWRCDPLPYQTSAGSQPAGGAHLSAGEYSPICQTADP